jgi:hypothetical protein
MFTFCQFQPFRQQQPVFIPLSDKRETRKTLIDQKLKEKFKIVAIMNFENSVEIDQQVCSTYMLFFLTLAYFGNKIEIEKKMLLELSCFHMNPYRFYPELSIIIHTYVNPKCLQF